MACKRLLRLNSVVEKTGDSVSGTYQKILDGLFPQPVKIGARASAWPEEEIDTIITAYIAGASNSELRNLVVQIHSARPTAVVDFRTNKHFAEDGP
tara:strand:+ start:6571 stop:6858 length:288 start_codon:yes stop_codon:yes gene_type:complete